MKRRAAFILLAALGILFLAAGLLSGGYSSVWAKAAAICSECIGLK